MIKNLIEYIEIHPYWWMGAIVYAIIGALFVFITYLAIKEFKNQSSSTISAK